MIIYKATNKINGKLYIGQTVRALDVRIAEHKRHKNTPFDKAVQVYGADNFDFEVIDTAETIDELNRKEKYWVNYYNAFGKNGYNACEGGGNTVGYHHTEESKKKMSVAHKGKWDGQNNPFYGKKHNAETKAKMSASRAGRIITDEWRKHLSESSPYKVRVHNIETDEIFNSIKEAADKYNIKPTHITRVCRGRRKSSGGYHWEYA